ncbi:MAG: S8 family serine peptidase [Gammaproteobacteria bacterium WSBS_2016_MAG_OTU1]
MQAAERIRELIIALAFREARAAMMQATGANTGTYNSFGKLRSAKCVSQMQAAERTWELITARDLRSAKCYCDAGGGANTGTYNSVGVCEAQSGQCNAGSGANTGTYNGLGVCIINTGACDAGGGAGSGMYDGSGVCEARSGACDISGGTNNGMYSGSGVCMINTGACDAGGGAGSGMYDGSGVCEARSGQCDISGGTNNGRYDGSGVCMINTGLCDAGGGANTGRYDGAGVCIEIYSDATTIPAPNDYNDSNYDETTGEYNLHYGLRAINAIEAYKRGYFGQGVTIGIVDAGIAGHHPDLTDKITLSINFGGNPATTDSHGTQVALFAAGSIGNLTNVIIDISGDRLTTAPFHGVAPMASIVPIRIGTDESLTGRSVNAFQHAVNNNIQIVNNSYGRPLRTIWKYEGRGDTFYSLESPYFKSVIDTESNSGFFKRTFVQYNTLATNADIVFVWSAGNDGWYYDEDNELPLVNDVGRFSMCGFATQTDASEHNDGSDCPTESTHRIDRATQQNLFDNLRGVDETDNPGDIFFNDVISRNDPGGYSLAPIYQEGLFGKWLVVGATQTGDRLASFSNGCGITKFWCLVAPGRSLRYGPSHFISGTSFSAPIVSGALAVLKSRLPSMPMEVVRAILLTTSTDLGVPGVDNVYGWGLVNLSAAINFQGDLLYNPVNLSITTHAGFDTAASITGSNPAPDPGTDPAPDPDPDPAPGIGIGIGGGTPIGGSHPLSAVPSTQALGRNIKLSETNIKLPANLAHVKNKLEAVEIAVGGVGDAYYNTKLSDLVNVEIAPAELLGDAAADMFLPANANHFGAGMLFAATDNKSGQFQYIGAEINNDDIGAWRFQHNFCDDCQRSVWQQWNVVEDNTITTPFFAQNKSNFVLQMQGDGLRPFAAMGGEVHNIDIAETPYQQFGLRWKQSHNKFGYTAEFSQINERNSFWGANFGAIGHAKTRTHQGRFALSGEIYKNWQAHVSYEQSFADVLVEEGGILSEISKLRAEGWAVGVEGQNVFWGGDRLRLSARRNTGIQKGTAKLGYFRAEGDFTCAFYKNVLGDEYDSLCGQAAAQQTVYTQSVINLAGAKDEIYALGYAMRLSDNTEWSIGAEYETKRNLAAFSAQLQIIF